MVVVRVLEIFDSLQGEGYWTGIPMTFVRLAGCNAPELGLGCTRWCDTRESWDRAAGEALDAGEVARRARLPRLCLTGGEPLLQGEGVAQLVAEARRRGMRAHVETNGTLDPPPTVDLPGRRGRRGRPFDWATVSPKPPGYMVAPGWAGLVDELKLVVDDHLDAATAERLAASHPEAVVCIQPQWETGGDAGRAGGTGGGTVGTGAEPGRGDSHGTAGASGGAAAERAIAMVMAHPEWRLSLQMHKCWGIR